MSNDKYWIYEIKCLKTDKRYVGQTGQMSPFSRWSEHMRMLSNNKSPSRLLQEEWVNYPSVVFWSFRVLAFVLGKRTANNEDAKHILETPDKMRLNCPGRSTESYARRMKAESMISSGVIYRDIKKETGLSVGMISKIKSSMLNSSIK